MENSITVGEELRKYFYDSGLNFLSSVPQRRILSENLRFHTGTILTALKTAL